MTNNHTSIELNKRVDLLKCLEVNIEVNKLSNLLLIKACGMSENESAGIPKLILSENNPEKLTDGILEFNFIIEGTDTVPIKKLEWEISVVYRMDVLPKGIKAIKVNAAKNADIALLLN